MGLQALAAVVGMVFAALAYLKGRDNHNAIAQNTAITTTTAAAVDGQASKLEAVARSAGYREGVIDQAGGVAPAPYPPAPGPKPE
jgi:hypothetical protein